MIARFVRLEIRPFIGIATLLLPLLLDGCASTGEWTRERVIDRSSLGLLVDSLTKAATPYTMFGTCFLHGTEHYNSYELHHVESRPLRWLIAQEHPDGGRIAEVVVASRYRIGSTKEQVIWLLPMKLVADSMGEKRWYLFEEPQMHPICLRVPIDTTVAWDRIPRKWTMPEERSANFLGVPYVDSGVDPEAWYAMLGIRLR